MDLNEKQVELLVNISKQNGDQSILEVGKTTYKTYGVIHKNINLFVDMGLVEYEIKKNKIIPQITEFGRGYLRTHL